MIGLAVWNVPFLFAEPESFGLDRIATAWWRGIRLMLGIAGN